MLNQVMHVQEEKKELLFNVPSSQNLFKCYYFKELVDLTEMPEPSTQKPWKVIGTTHLYSADKMVLKSGWLNDKIIHASQ